MHIPLLLLHSFLKYLQGTSTETIGVEKNFYKKLIPWICAKPTVLENWRRAVTVICGFVCSSSLMWCRALHSSVLQEHLGCNVVQFNVVTCVSSRHSQKCVTLLKLRTEWKTSFLLLGLIFLYFLVSKTLNCHKS